MLAALTPRLLRRRRRVNARPVGRGNEPKALYACHVMSESLQMIDAASPTAVRTTNGPIRDVREQPSRLSTATYSP